MRTPKPFYRKFNDTWYVQISKRQIRLAKGKDNEKEAYCRYYAVMAEHPTGTMPALGRLVPSLTMMSIWKLLGHISTDMVMRHYNHISQRREHLHQAAIKATQGKSE